jgi:hypothetical protein
MTPEQERALAIAQALLKLGNPADIRREQMRANIAAAKAGASRVSPDAAQRAGAADQIAKDQMTLSGAPAALRYLDKFNQGVPFFGQWTDELTGLISPQAAEQQRAVREAMDRQNPVSSAAAQMAGGLVGGAAMLGLAGPAVAAPATLGGQVIGGIAGGTALGAAEGFASGTGRGQPGNRVATGLRDAGLGAAFGGALGAVAPVAAKGFSWLWQNMRGRDVSAIMRELDIDRPAALTIRNALMYEDPALAQQALQRAGKGAMLADAGPALGQQLDNAMANSPQALATARKAIGERLDDTALRLNNMLDMAFGKPEGAKAAARGITQRTAAQRDAAFKSAFAAPINYADDTGRAVEDVLDRLPPNILNKAVAKANEAMRFEGRKNMQIMATISPDGSKVTFQSMPNVEQLHQIKMALGELAEAGKDALGRMTPDGRLYSNMARTVRDAIVDATGGQGGVYSRAMKLGGDKIAEQNAFDLGRRALSPAVTREEFADALVSQEAKLAAARGLRTSIDETLANVKAAFTDPNVDVRAAAKLVRDMSSPAVRQKVSAILGDKRAAVVFRALDEGAAAFEARAAVATNSKTAPRLAGEAAMNVATQPGIATRAMRGEVMQAAKQTAQGLAGVGDEALLALKQGQWDQVAQALTSIRGPAAAKALTMVRAAMAGQPMKSGQAAFIGRILSGGLALGGYQSGTRRLQSPTTAQ